MSICVTQVGLIKDSLLGHVSIRLIVVVRAVWRGLGWLGGWGVVVGSIACGVAHDITGLNKNLERMKFFAV